MLLIADSGSTKTDWRLVDGRGDIFSFSSEGINPFFHTAESVALIVEKLGIESNPEFSVTDVFFYGAGCSNEENLSIIRNGLQLVFKKAESINVHHDLLGAARALFHNKDGIAGILGTGSNSCLFQAGEVVQQLGGQGYLIGDEGSGLHLGRKLVRDYMNHLMPSDVEAIFEKQAKFTRKEIVDAIYNKPYPNRFLASFSKIVFENIKHPYINDLAHDAIGKFMKRYIAKYSGYQNLSLRLVGSVAYYYKDVLDQEASKIGTKVDLVLKSPIEGLINYHANQNV